MLAKVAPLVHIKKLIYLFSVIAIALHALHQVYFSWINEHL